MFPVKSTNQELEEPWAHTIFNILQYSRTRRIVGAYYIRCIIQFKNRHTNTPDLIQVLSPTLFFFRGNKIGCVNHYDARPIAHIPNSGENMFSSTVSLKRAAEPSPGTTDCWKSLEDRKFIILQIVAPVMKLFWSKKHVTVKRQTSRITRLRLNFELYNYVKLSMTLYYIWRVISCVALLSLSHRVADLYLHNNVLSRIVTIFSNKIMCRYQTPVVL